ncbi:MAG: hypothetical protein NTX00_02725 [Candidatus Parcubacteria bacterium]|nr:hypothetical protein [Candidatus Parcubacteria bacterium]
MNKKLIKLMLWEFFNLKFKVFIGLVLMTSMTYLGFNFFNAVNASAINYTENFTSDTYKDSVATTGKWDTVLNQARLLGKDWVSMAENMSGAETISNGGGVSKVLLNSANDPYIVWEGPGLAGFNDIFFTKWTPGVGWTQMDGATLGSDSLSNNIGQSFLGDMAIDNLGNPYVVWWDRTLGQAEIFFTKWTPGAGAVVCGGPTDCWTNMAGTIAGYENISNTPASESDTVQIKLDSANNPFIVWREFIGSGEIRIVRWTLGPGWTKMDGTPGFDNLSPGLSTNDDPQILIDTLNNPYVVWQGNFFVDIYFSKWTPGAGAVVCGGPTDCWTNMAGTALGYENISNTASSSLYPDFKLDSLNNPYVVWHDSTTGGGDIYFSKWTANPVACAPNLACWTKMDGVTLGYDNLSNNAGNNTQPFIRLDTANNPYVVWSDYTTGNIDIYFSKWTVGAGPGICGGIINDCWTNMAGTALGYDNVSNDPELSIMSEQGITLDSANNPYLVWDIGLPARVTTFSKWTPGAGPGICGGIINDCWTKMDGALGYEIIENTAASYSGVQLDPLNNVYIFNGGPQFAKWLPIFKLASTIQSLNINTSGQQVIKATLNATETLNLQPAINYFLSNNGGVSWSPVTKGVEFTFASNGNDLRWQANLQTLNNNITPVINSLTVDYVTLGGGGGVSLPTTPLNLSCQALSSSAISWNFEDTATNETGFRLYGPQGFILDTGNVNVENLNHLEETNLAPNTLYNDRQVTAFNGSGESGQSNTASCYTLANTPLEPIIGAATENSIVVKINPGDNNPANTEYAIKELNSGQYINLDGTFGLAENWQTYANWGGNNGVVINGEPLITTQPLSNVNAQIKISLASGTTYNFAVKARNGDGVETAFSGSTSGDTETPPAPPPSPPPVTPPPVTPPPVTPPPVTPPPVIPPTTPVTPPTMPVTPPAVTPPLVLPAKVTPPAKPLITNTVKQVSQNIITPILLILAALNTIPAVLALTISVLPYLHLLFIEPFLWFFRGKRRKWGIVYDALTKLPVSLAVVRLYSKENKRLIQTKVTDKEGRYLLIVKETGQYYLSVTKPDYIFPTRYLREEKQDVKYLDLYHGEEIEVTQKGGVVTANIPLDPRERKMLTEKEAVKSYLLKNVRLMVSYIGMILALLIILIYPTIITVSALVIHIILFLLFRRLIVPPKPKSWGIIYDEKSKQPIGQGIVRIFEIRFNKLLETQVTDSKGRYAFLVGKNEYQLLAEKAGYEKKGIKPVDLIKKDQIVNLDLGLRKIKI